MDHASNTPICRSVLASTIALLSLLPSTPTYSPDRFSVSVCPSTPVTTPTPSSSIPLLPTDESCSPVQYPKEDGRLPLKCDNCMDSNYPLCTLGLLSTMGTLGPMHEADPNKAWGFLGSECVELSPTLSQHERKVVEAIVDLWAMAPDTSCYHITSWAAQDYAEAFNKPLVRFESFNWRLEETRELLQEHLRDFVRLVNHHTEDYPGPSLILKPFVDREVAMTFDPLDNCLGDPHNYYYDDDDIPDDDLPPGREFCHGRRLQRLERVENTAWEEEEEELERMATLRPWFHGFVPIVLYFYSRDTTLSKPATFLYYTSDKQMSGLEMHDNCVVPTEHIRQRHVRAAVY
ncbi:uncharacterized protein BXZ73DRAFT_81170 [Epithele typhae]|uniref:uncharacterized protein n=1 Tax=Epithele typhae TaxID=378194 RepID=UPI0020083273|nr:uncharacterized protein BXZ73DRAFT_81170 [Epithele typhae]KAH9916091.1 hypothetical protein BXZ73DRAFT_81170 [Epithele typhae]